MDVYTKEMAHVVKHPHEIGYQLGINTTRLLTYDDCFEVIMTSESFHLTGGQINDFDKRK